jgi:hypothetical protein
VLWSSSPVMASRRSTGTPAARLAASWRMRRSPPSLNHWLPASNLKPGEHLKTPDGQAAVVVVEGSILAVHDGWMWDLTVQDDHDFYVEPAAALPPSSSGPVAAALVHNCTPAAKVWEPGRPETDNEHQGPLPAMPRWLNLTKLSKRATITMWLCGAVPFGRYHGRNI